MWSKFSSWITAKCRATHSTWFFLAKKQTCTKYSWLFFLVLTSQRPQWMSSFCIFDKWPICYSLHRQHFDWLHVARMIATRTFVATTYFVHAGNVTFGFTCSISLVTLCVWIAPCFANKPIIISTICMWHNISLHIERMRQLVDKYKFDLGSCCSQKGRIYIVATDNE